MAPGFDNFGLMPEWPPAPPEGRTIENGFWDGWMGVARADVTTRVCVCVFSFERGLKMFLRAKRGAINNIFSTHSCGQAGRIERDFATLRRTTNRHQQAAAAVLEKEGTSPLGSPYRGSGTLA